MHSATYAVVHCPFVCVCLSVMFVFCVETSKHILNFFHRLVEPAF